MTGKTQIKVAIQGIEASFHDVAAGQFFSANVIPVECATFKILSEKLAKKEADFAVMAIENTIAGSILTNYSLLERYHFKIIGEVYLRIELSLLSLPDQKLEDIKFVQSHPMALHQCEDFFYRHPHLRAVESNDTAESAKDISARQLKGQAAIASSLAGERYGLKVLESSIESNKQNYTRFLAIAREVRPEQIKNANKASLRFETENRPGSLMEILEIFKNHELNMTKIQSVPILGRPYQYSIHVDLEWANIKNYEAAMNELSQRSMQLLHFGEYQKGERPE